MRKILRFLKEYFIGGSPDKPLSKKKKRFFGLFTFLLFIGAIAVFIAVLSIKIYNTESRNSDFNKNASVICSDLISETGTSRVEHLDIPELENSWHMLGISAVRRIDFNADGKDELLVAYFKGGKYYVEVWGSKGGEFVRFYKEEANSLKICPELGSWLTIYHNGDEYYIGKLNEVNEENKNNEKNMDLFALSGSEFKEKSKCFFDAKAVCYLFNDEIDNVDFETIQFSALSSAKAEYQLNSVQDSLVQFINAGEVADSVPKTDEQKKASVFSKVIDDKIKKFGEPQVASSGSSAYANGVAVVDLVDFNGDSNSELLIISRNKKDYDDTDAYPKYLTEIFVWDGEIAKKVYEGNTTSTYFDSWKNDIFYILQKKDSKINLCFNTYSFGENPDVSWNALSTIVEMVSDTGFETAFTAYKRKNYDYVSYKLNGEYSYKSEFEKKGYTVPYFCGNEDFDKEEFSIAALKSDESKKSDIEQVIKNTENVIKQINNGSAK